MAADAPRKTPTPPPRDRTPTPPPPPPRRPDSVTSAAEGNWGTWLVPGESLADWMVVTYEEVLIRTGFLLLCSNEAHEAIVDVLRPALGVTVAMHTLLITMLAPSSLVDVVCTSAVVTSGRRMSIRMLSASERNDVMGCSSDPDATRRNAVERLAARTDNNAVELRRRTDLRNRTVREGTPAPSWWMHPTFRSLWAVLLPMYNVDDAVYAIERETLGQIVGSLRASPLGDPDKLHLAECMSIAHGFLEAPGSHHVEALRDNVESAGRATKALHVAVASELYARILSECHRDTVHSHFQISKEMLLQCAVWLAHPPVDVLKRLVDISYELISADAQSFAELAMKGDASGTTLEQIMVEATVVYDRLLDVHGDSATLSSVATLMRVYSDIFRARWGEIALVTPEHFEAMAVVHRVVVTGLLNDSGADDFSGLEADEYSVVWSAFAWLNEAARCWCVATHELVTKYMMNALRSMEWGDILCSEEPVVHCVLHDVCVVLHQQLPALDVILCEDYLTLFEAFTQCMRVSMQMFIESLLLVPVLPVDQSALEAIVRLNTIHATKAQFETFIAAVLRAWSRAVPKGQCPDAEVLAARMSLDSGVKSAMGRQFAAISSFVVAHPTVEKVLMGDLYTIDMKHYKKYKKDKKLLAQSASAHLCPGTPTTIETVCEAVKDVVLPVVLRTEFKASLLRFVYNDLCAILVSVVLDGGELRWFHEHHAQKLFEDTCALTEFFQNACGDPSSFLNPPRPLLFLRGLLSGPMTQSSPDLVGLFATLPKEDPELFVRTDWSAWASGPNCMTNDGVPILTRALVYAILSHRKDRAAKDFIIKMRKTLPKKVVNWEDQS
eukprot:PhM_4_TR18721/c0_g1_i2/m.11718